MRYIPRLKHCRGPTSGVTPQASRDENVALFAPGSAWPRERSTATYIRVVVQANKALYLCRKLRVAVCRVCGMFCAYPRCLAFAPLSRTMEQVRQKFRNSSLRTHRYPSHRYEYVSRFCFDYLFASTAALLLAVVLQFRYYSTYSSFFSASEFLRRLGSFVGIFCLSASHPATATPPSQSSSENRSPPPFFRSSRAMLCP